MLTQNDPVLSLALFPPCSSWYSILTFLWTFYIMSMLIWTVETRMETYIIGRSPPKTIKMITREESQRSSHVSQYTSIIVCSPDPCTKLSKQVRLLQNGEGHVSCVFLFQHSWSANKIKVIFFLYCPWNLCWKKVEPAYLNWYSFSLCYAWILDVCRKLKVQG